MTKKPLDDIQAAESLRSTHQAAWNRYVKLYMGERVNVIYKGDHNPFVMETHTIVESLVAHIAGGEAEIDFMPTNPEQRGDTKIMAELINYWLEQNDFEVTEQLGVRGSIIKGNAYWYAEWDPVKKCPIIRLIEVDDILIDPTSTSITNADFVGHTYLTSKSALKEAKAYDKDGKLVNKYNKVDEIGTFDIKKLNPQVRKKLESSTLGAQAMNEQVVMQVLYYTDGRIIEVANGKKVIREADSPYQREEKTELIDAFDESGPIKVERKLPAIAPVLPYAEVRGFINPNTPFAHGEVSLIADRQEHLNELEAQDLDNTGYINNVMSRIDPQYENYIDKIVSEPGFTAVLPRGAFEWLDRPIPNIDLDNKKREIKDEMRRVTGADEIVQGVSNERSRVTATEIGTQLEQSAKRFQMRIDNLENEGFRQLTRVLLRFAQLFVTEEMMVRIIGPEGVEFKNFNPAEYEGDFEPVVKLRTSVERQKREMDNRMQPAWELILADPQVDRIQAMKMFLKERGFEEENIKLLLGGNNAQGITGNQGGLQVPGEQPIPQGPAPLLGA